MSKKVDLTGRVFGKLSVIELIGQDKYRNSIYRCRCECGEETTALTAQLQRGAKKSCGCTRKGFTSGEGPKDLVGTNVGYFTVIAEAGTVERNGSGKIKTFEVECVCGKKLIVPRSKLYNPTANCGCMTSLLKTKALTEDLTGQKFGRLTAIEHTRTKSGHSAWKCICECGNEVVVQTHGLKSGKTQSCGCLHADICRKDISGQTFGLLRVIDMAYTDKEYVYWNCVCACGERRVVSGASLRSGNTISCGCSKSKGEMLISLFLRKHNIHYTREKTFIKCRNIYTLLFDFWLPDYGMCIEYDGQQHFEKVRLYGEALEDIQRRDAIKTKYCEENGIVLLRIPYWEKQNQESILKEWLFLDDE